MLVGVGAPHFKSRRTRHAVPQRLHPARPDIDPVDMEELDVGHRSAIHPFEDFRRIGALDLEPVVRAVDRPAVRPAVGARIVQQPHLPFADSRLELDPVRRRRAPDEDELVGPLAENDHVADDMTGGRHRHEVFGAVEIEVGEGIDADVLEEPLRVRSLDDEFVHVMGLVEQDGRLAP